MDVHHSEVTTYPLDRELAPAVGAIPTLDFTDVVGARAAAEAMLELYPPTDLTGVSVEDLAIPVQGDTIRLKITGPTDRSGPLPVIYDLHPGGFCLGSVEQVHPRDVELARQVGAVVVAADYRLAPEHPFPTPLEDCYEGLNWIASNAGRLGADAGRIALLGQSGGGGLAAALALLARDRGGPAIVFQYLGVPQLDDRMTSPSMTRFVDTPVLDRGGVEQSWSHYLGDLKPGSAEVPAYAAPARATDLRELPPAYIAAMQFDVMRDEAIAYAQALLAADVHVELHLFPGTFHASWLIGEAEVSRRELEEQVRVFRKALAA